jgi:hypothetical protein
MEYTSIMKNDVWEVVPKPEGKRWLDLSGSTRSSMQQMEAWTITKKASWSRGFHRERELTRWRLSPRWPGIPRSEKSYRWQQRSASMLTM